VGRRVARRPLIGQVDIDPGRRVDVVAPPEAQADELSEDWVRRVHEQLAALETPA
jgi:LPS sulfotransferase NodH